ncbi:MULTISPECIES: four-carbon acid sugar kinase family protein [Natrialbaceae]|uniref:four-carbon acid sugar kinase family protein n=1 Tax=Natrialbaceae TaxID=1644061 RepID=UPI00207CE146|nr:four-carbon acid sugar kinase family protein [Natronococcus sp. CG52]
MSDYLLSFYGDDITGSTDAMDALSRRGIETVLFFEPPDPEKVSEEFDDAQAVGVAGTSRSMNPDEMTESLPSVFEQLAEIDAPLLHYKICSTFDSSPEIGSIGTAIDVAEQTLETGTVPVFPAAPPLGRYVVFGNMFAEEASDIYRLDCHPTMSEHPVTPMDESNLLEHLSKQTEKSMELLDVLSVEEGATTLEEELPDARERSEVLFFDALNKAHMTTFGEVCWEVFGKELSETSFIVGSSGVEYALSSYWKSAGVVNLEPEYPPLPAVDQVLVMSGSASPMTDRQIAAAKEAGFSLVPIDTPRLVDPDTRDAEKNRINETAEALLENGESVVVYTARGPNDSIIDETIQRADDVEFDGNIDRRIGKTQGVIVRRLLSETDITRVGIAGGDTCGYVTSMLDISALKTRFPLASGAPVCRAYSNSERFDGLELALKGGQLGGKQFFVKLRDGASEWKDN